MTISPHNPGLSSGCRSFEKGAAVKKFKAWIALEDSAFNKTMGGLIGQQAWQIFESCFMTSHAFKTTMSAIISLRTACYYSRKTLLSKHDVMQLPGVAPCAA